MDRWTHACWVTADELQRKERHQLYRHSCVKIPVLGRGKRGTRNEILEEDFHWLFDADH